MNNRLATQTSPYLRQHAENPVDWHPWDDQALGLARRSGRPILLSVGYSACHWCHVMAHESFEDPAVARVMNEHFVNIKVDREERPDLDRVYQLAQQLLTRQPGGWPLTMFLDPDTRLPFFGGTYFPPKPRHGLPGFMDLLIRVSEIFHSRRDDLKAQGGKISAFLDGLNTAEPGQGELTDTALLDAGVQALHQQYDATEGGFGSAPKFPMPGALDWLLGRWAAGRRGGRGVSGREALDMVMHTLTKMARGGIHDHLGGGFCRYATDARWMIPHFEKMLYDNGQMLSLYSDALGVGPDALFEHAVRGITDWLLRDMRHPGGAFYAAQDADSEGEEGKYYVWHRDDVKRLLDPDEYLIVETLYGLDKPANFHRRWHLHRYDAWPAVASRLSLEAGQAEALLDSARAKLLRARETRVQPERDDKILTAWNALAIKGLAKAAVRLERPDWLRAAQQAADFLRNELWADGILHASWHSGSPVHRGYLDDYAFLLDAMVTLLSVSWRDCDAQFALALADALQRDFEDQDAGGFYFTAHDHEALIYRPKPTQDDAMPSGNAVAARALQDLGHLFGESGYLESADRTIVWARRFMEQAPAAHTGLLAALAEPPEQIIIRGPRPDLDPWLRRAHAGYHPSRRVYAIPYADDIRHVPAYLPRLVSADLAAMPVAYRCEGFSCAPPLTTLEDFKSALAED